MTIRVNLVYEVIPVDCEFCGKNWIAIIETDEIDWGNGNTEVKLVETAECPSCSKTTNINREND